MFFIKLITVIPGSRGMCKDADTVFVFSPVQVRPLTKLAL